MLIAIDGGGSTARLGIFNRGLECLEKIESSESLNPSSLGFHECCQRVENLLCQLLQKVHLQKTNIQSVCWGIAGADRHQEELLQWFKKIFPTACLTGVPDFEIALVGGLKKTTGILLLSGTGSVVYGKNHLGQTKRVGGWGWFLGDEGSGFWIGQEAIRLVAKVYDQRLDETPLFDAVCHYLHISNPHELLACVYSKTIEPRFVAQLAPIVIDYAQEDPLALDILYQASERLHKLFMTVAIPLELSAQETVFAGGILTKPSPLRDQLQKSLKLSKPPLPLHSPLIGAAILAAKALDD